MGNGNTAFVGLHNWEGVSLQKVWERLPSYRLLERFVRPKKAEQHGALHLKSFAVNVAQAGLIKKKSHLCGCVSVRRRRSCHTQSHKVDQARR